MLDPTTALSFAATAAAMVVTPGAGFVLFSSTMLARGRRAALAVGSGIIVGTVTLAALVIAGYPLVLGRTAGVQRILHLVGGAYLVYLGVRGIVRAIEARRHSSRLALALGRAHTHVGSAERQLAIAMVASVVLMVLGLRTLVA